MEYYDCRDTSPPSGPKSSTLTTTTPYSSPPDFGTNNMSSSMYHSIFQDTEQRLNRTRQVLEYQQLYDHYDICLSCLQDFNGEIETLRRENADLQLANTALLKILTSSFNYPNIKEVSAGEFSPKSVIEPNRSSQNTNVLGRDHFLPKSNSVRTSGYMKANQPNTTESDLIRSRVEKREEERNASVEMELYNQGMWKTELCNKWEQTATCPYAQNCQFAHGITELQPIIRHPKYKTQVCKMVLYGDACPYGHRCHFRHSLTQQERLLLPR
ncbi:hypothetical protein Ddye_012130 [Dipteronia dyeriana]|uniref:C3H1-type domain-containing protein n=1 Tax=Dipteronia dyeriana TaxID=168575 RepID=A0AAD9X3W1_9ROSI|nr:hypothetical protein Ddye_012130 [Dipteronia dyeriana]